MARKVDIRFLLEWHQPGKPVRSMVLPPVSRYAPAFSAATDSEWTMGDRPVKQKSGLREFPISISGISSYRRSKNYDASGAQITAKGTVLFEEFVNFIQAWEAEGARLEGPITGNEEEAPRLIFRSMQDTATDEAWYVEIQNFTPVRDTNGARLIRSYTLELKTEGPVSEKRSSKLVGTPSQQTDSQKKITTWLDYLPTKSIDPSELESTLPTQRPDGVQISSLQDFINDTSVVYAAFKAPVKTFLETCKSVRDAAGAARNLARLPQNVINGIADAATIALDTLSTIYDAIPGANKRAEAKDVFADVYGAIEQMRSDALTMIGLQNGRHVPNDTGANNAIYDDTPAVAGTEVVTASVDQGETLPSFAYRLLGDPLRWAEIMELNELPTPFAGPDGESLTGLFLLVPSPGSTLQKQPSGILFGSDIRLDGRHIVLDGTTEFARVRGDDNLNQGLERRLELVEGSNIAFPQLGLPPLIGEPGVAGTAAYIAMVTREKLLRDGRVRRVINPSVTRKSGGRYSGSCQVETVSGKTIPIVAMFQS